MKNLKMLIVAIITMAASHVGNAQSDNGEKLYSNPTEGFLPDPNFPGQNAFIKDKLEWVYDSPRRSSSIPLVTILDKTLNNKGVIYRGWSKRPDGSISSYLEGKFESGLFVEFNSKTHSFAKINDLPPDRVNDERGYHKDNFRVNPGVYKSLEKYLAANGLDKSANAVSTTAELENNIYEGSLKKLAAAGLFELKLAGDNKVHVVEWTVGDESQSDNFKNSSLNQFVETLTSGTFIVYTVAGQGDRDFEKLMAEGKTIEGAAVRKTPATKDELKDILPDFKGLQK